MDCAICTYTSFVGDDLRRIYRLFGLANVADEHGIIRVSNGHTRYKLHAEELFLFFMTRMKKGWSICDTVNTTFGGYCHRWGYGWSWIVRYLDDRYRNILGHQGLLRFVDEFPQYFEAIDT